MAGWGNSRWGNSAWGFGDIAGVLYAKLSVIPSFIVQALGMSALFSGKASITVMVNEKSMSVTSMQAKSSVSPDLQATTTVVGALQIKNFTIIPLS